MRARTILLVSFLLLFVVGCKGYTSGVIEINGTAMADGFTHYDLMVKGPNDQDFTSAGITLLNNGLQEVNRSTLGYVDTINYSDGDYIVKFNVFSDIVNETMEDYLYFTIDNVALLYPEQASVLNTSMGEIDLMGSIYKNNLLNYTVRTKKEGENYSEDRITYLLNRTEPFENEVFAKWNITDLASGNYLVYISVYVDEEGELYSYEEVYGFVIIGPDSYEPDNTVFEATTLELNDTEQFHTLHDADDIDYFTFEATAGEWYDLDTFNLTTNFRVRMELFDSALNFIDSDTYSSDYPNAPRIVFQAETNGIHLVKMYSKYEEKDVGAYFIQARTVNVDEYEPDNYWDEATSITVDGETQTHSVIPWTDTDNIKFDVVGGEYYSIFIEPLADNLSLMIDYEIEDEEVESKSNFDERKEGLDWSENENRTLKAAENGTIYAAVRNGNGASGGEYKLWVTMANPGLDAYEPDDTFDEANIILTNGTKQFHNFSYSYDEDFVKFDALADVEYIIETTDLDPAGDTEFRVYDPDKDYVAYADGNGSDIRPARLEFKAEKNGTHYIKVTDYFDREGSYYNLSVLEIIEEEPYDNLAPIIESKSPEDDVSLNLNDTQEFLINVTDNESDTISYQWLLNGSSVGDNISSYLFDAEIAGNFTLVVIASDDFNSTNTSWLIEIIDVPVEDNIAPVINNKLPEDDVLLFIQDVQEFSINASDNENDTLSYEWFLDEVSVNNDSSSYEFNATAANNHTLKIVVSDGLNSTNTSWAIQVTDVPTSDDFTGSFENLDPSEVSNATNITINSSSAGIDFGDSVLDFTGIADLDTLFTIADGVVGMDSSAAPGLNKSARIVMEGLSYTNPIVLYNSNYDTNATDECPDDICSNYDYSGGVLSFDISHFSVFVASENQTNQSEGLGSFNVNDIFKIGDSDQRASNPLAKDRGSRDEFIETGFSIGNNGTGNITDLNVSIVPVTPFNLGDINISKSFSKSYISPGETITLDVRSRIPEILDAVNPDTLKRSAFKVADVYLTGITTNNTALQHTAVLKMQRENMLELDHVMLCINDDCDKVTSTSDIADIKVGDKVDIKIKVKNGFSTNDNEDIDLEDILVEYEVEGHNFDESDDEELGDLSAGDDNEGIFTFDVDTETEDGNYDLFIRASAEDENEALHGEAMDLRIKIVRKSHDITIKEVSISPANFTCRNNKATAKITIANYGQKSEREVAIEISNSDLDINKRLGTFKLDSGDMNTYSIPFEVKEGAKRGDYTLRVKSYFATDAQSDEEHIKLIIPSCDVKKEEPVDEKTEEEEKSEDAETEEKSGKTEVQQSNQTTQVKSLADFGVPPVDLEGIGAKTRPKQVKSSFMQPKVFVPLMIVGIIILLAILAMLVFWV